jgi:alanyl-tRNA synthetase
VTSKFTAEKWLNEAALAFRGQVAPPKGQNPTEVCNMKPKKVSITIVDEKIQEAIERSRKFAEDFLRS